MGKKFKPEVSKTVRYDLEWIRNNCYINKNNCWVWNRSLHIEGYGQFCVVNVKTKKRKLYTTHRYVYQLINGKLEDNTLVCHTCHNRACCNPDHLYAGSHTDNWWDSEEIHRMNLKKLSSRKRKGLISIPSKKLNEKIVRRSRRKYATGNYSVSDIARDLNVSRPTTISMLKGHTWVKAKGPINKCRKVLKTK